MSPNWARTLGRRNRSILIYSPANLNALDGSSVWTQTLAMALSLLPRVQVGVVLGHRQTTDRLTKPLVAFRNIEIIDTFDTSPSDTLDIESATELVAERLAGVKGALIVRGMEAARQMARHPGLSGRIWPYLTDIPQQVDEIDENARLSVEEIAAAAPIMLFQTEELRDFVESNFPETRGKGRVLPPIIPDGITPVALAPPTPAYLNLVYSGKFAPMWNTLEMCALPAQLKDHGVQARLVMVGEKINQDPNDPNYVEEMRSALLDSFGVDWVGGVSRDEAIDLVAKAHIGLGWRATDMDQSLELSTKLLEYCAAGTPPLMNRNPMHERIFGPSYPLLIGAGDSIPDLLGLLARKPELFSDALEQTSHIADDYTATAAATRLKRMLKEAL